MTTMTESSKAVANRQANRSKQFLENYDKIFGPKTKPTETTDNTPETAPPKAD